MSCLVPTGLLLYLRHFLQDDTAFARMDEIENAIKRAVIAKNRTVLKRNVNVLMVLGHQGLPCTG